MGTKIHIKISIVAQDYSMLQDIQFTPKFEIVFGISLIIIMTFLGNRLVRRLA
jgi:ATP/ADP translocase